jgi:hypothetical protein
LRASTAAFIDERELLAAYLDLITMQQGRWLRTEAHPINQHLGFWNRLADYDLSVGLSSEFRMTGEHTRKGQRDGAGWI